MPRLISADCHVNEPPWVFDRVPAEYRDRAPKMLRGADGGDGWSFGFLNHASWLGLFFLMFESIRIVYSGGHSPCKRIVYVREYT